MTDDCCAEKLSGKEPPSMACASRPKKEKGGRGSVNRLPLSPALISTSDLDNLYKASQECRRGVNWKDSVIGFQSNLISNLSRLKAELISGRYRIMPYKRFVVYEPKERKIEATYHRDRVVQRALCNAYLYDGLTRHFIYDNGANQKGKGTDFTRGRLKVLLHRHYLRNGPSGYVAYVDIHHFFDSIPHEVALEAVKKRAPDPFAVDMCRMAIENHEGSTGIGLGSELSQLMALSVLDGVDHWAKEKMKAKCYVRYMDDSVAVFKTKEEAQRYLKGTREELSKLGLEASEKKTLVFPLKNGINFLGWRYILKSNGRLILKPKKGKIPESIRKLRRMKRAGVPIETIRQSKESMVASLEYGNAAKEIKRLERFFKEELENGR
ncbi:MAG: RNA-directed DNA polymerase [Bacilli bacterium]|nr:RNA-directed DNA polymerase [Bacilli bacterium]